MNRLTRVLPLAALLSSQVLAVPLAGAAGKKVKVAILADHAHDEALARQYAKQIVDIAAGEPGLEVVVVDPAGQRGDSKPETLRALLDALLQDKNVDVVLTTGLLGSLDAVRRGSLPKPVVCAELLDPALAGAPRSGEGSGVKNLTYIADPGALERDLVAMRELGFARPVLLVGRFAQAALGTRLLEKAKAAGLAASMAPVDAARAAEVIGALPAGTDAAALIAIDELPPPAVNALLAAASNRKIRVYSTRGAADVQAGAVAGLADARSMEQQMRRAAIDILRVAGGENAATIPVGFQRSESLILNLAAAQRAGWAPPFSVLNEAETIGELGTVEAGEKLTLRGIAEQVVAKNLDFEAGGHQLEAANEDEDKAVSYLLPKVTLSLEGQAIDARRAEAGMGTQPSRQLLGVIEAKAVLFSDKLWANLSIQDRLALLRDLQRKAQELDLVLEAGTAYFGVLQTQVLERVRVENAKTSRVSLNQARTKQKVGSAMATEVLRWESQLAIDQREVLKARSMRRLAEMQLNRLRHQKLESPFMIGSEQMDAGTHELVPDRLAAYLGDANAFATFREFLVEEGLNASPELKAANEAVEASGSASGAAWRAVFIPTLAFGVKASWRIAKGGPGAEAPTVPADVPPQLAGLLTSFVPQPLEDPLWQVGGILSLPLPLDLEAFSDIRRADAELAQRERERDAGREKIEQRIRSAAYKVAASMPGVKLAQKSADAAHQALAIAQEAYAAGSIGILELIDARNQALNADQGAVAAMYELMVDELQLQRAVGSFYFLKDKEEQNAWVQRAVEYLSKPR